MRTLRYRQAIRKGHYTGGMLEGVSYKKAVTMYQMLMRAEDNTPTIPQARVMHKALGTWDADTRWESKPYYFQESDRHNRMYVKAGLTYRVVYPKADYKFLKGLGL